VGRRGDGVELEFLAFLIAKPVSTNSNDASTMLDVPTGDRRISGGEFDNIWSAARVMPYRGHQISRGVKEGVYLGLR